MTIEVLIYNRTKFVVVIENVTNVLFPQHIIDMSGFQSTPLEVKEGSTLRATILSEKKIRVSRTFHASNRWRIEIGKKPPANYP